MKTDVLLTHTQSLFTAAVRRASELLQAGEVVGLPTETVYGLAANALNAEAVARVFTVKGRPAHNPIIVHVADVAMAKGCVAAWPGVAEKLARAFWPGPLTLVLPRSREIPDIVTAAGPTVGVRWPSHPLIQEVIRACGFPLAAPSANPAGQLSPTTAGHVHRYFGGKIPLIVDGGATQVGIESTVLDLSRHPAQVLRPGMIHMESLQAALGDYDAELNTNRGQAASAEDEPLRSPGQLPKHYSPRARLVVWEWRDDADLRLQIANFKVEPAQACIIAHARIPSAAGFGRVSVIPHDPEAFARALYAELHRCDEMGAGLIIVEALPPEVAWQGIADRLKRAATQE